MVRCKATDASDLDRVVSILVRWAAGALYKKIRVAAALRCAM